MSEQIEFVPAKPSRCGLAIILSLHPPRPGCNFTYEQFPGLGIVGTYI